MKLLRKGAMSAACNYLAEIACEKDDDFSSVMEDIYKLLRDVQKSRKPGCTTKSAAFNVGDPTVVQGRGAPKKTRTVTKRRHCSNCRGIGHTIRTCPVLLYPDQVNNNETGDSASEGIVDSTDDETNVGSVDRQNNGASVASKLKSQQRKQGNDSSSTQVSNKRSNQNTVSTKQNKRKSKQREVPVMIHSSQVSVNEVTQSSPNNAGRSDVDNNRVTLLPQHPQEIPLTQASVNQVQVYNMEPIVQQVHYPVVRASAGLPFLQPTYAVNMTDGVQRVLFISQKGQAQKPGACYK
ncbi:uncharacterized protein LOC130736397 [Lotus japonicus]|uniref:uncharacterized protein LOC130736397 n=1 Tax=Lotus japonicus TaxID=34305 RepID=UPI002585E39A|nr:uncharacterized protein LOC130736397 [Lotus japonicus]